MTILKTKIKCNETKVPDGAMGPQTSKLFTLYIVKHKLKYSLLNA